MADANETPCKVCLPSRHDVPVGTATDAARFLAIMYGRFAERPEAVAVRGSSSTVITIGVSDGVRLHDMGSGGKLFTYLNPGAPACYIKFINGALWFNDQQGELTWQELMHLAETQPVALPRNTPYLYVANNEVRGIVFVGDGGWMTDDRSVPYGGAQQDIALYCLILAGVSRPDFLRFAGDVNAFVAGLWQAVDHRYLRPAGNRLLRLTNYLTCDITDRVAIVKYARTDGASPAIAVGEPYVLWGAGEDMPGGHSPKTGPYTATLLEVLTGTRPGR